MAIVDIDWSEMPESGRTRYDWEFIFDGSTHYFTLNEVPKTFASTVKQAASKRELDSENLRIHKFEADTVLPSGKAVSAGWYVCYSK